MPINTRRQAQAQLHQAGRAPAGRAHLIHDDIPAGVRLDEHDPGHDDPTDFANDEAAGEGDDESDGDGDVDEGMEEDDGNEIIVEDFEPEPELFPPPGLKEISSLASWTVSSAKPGNGVAALRSLDTTQFWQSDGPQPHLLSIHFFKLVPIVYMRMYLDIKNDESYTPTKMQFLAGMSVHDLQEFAEMTFEEPKGWIDVDFSNVGPCEEDDVDMHDGRRHEVDWSKRPVLRAFLVQVKILENHQNGKDTHLRALQLFARDESSVSQQVARQETQPKALPSRRKPSTSETNNIALAPWMLEPDLR